MDWRMVRAGLWLWEEGDISFTIIHSSTSQRSLIGEDTADRDGLRPFMVMRTRERGEEYFVALSVGRAESVSSVD